MERLSTGKRINSAADDAAGVAIASRLTSEIKGTNQAIRNAMDGQAMIDTAEGAHQEIEFILQRMRELAVQASNDSNSDADRTALQSEVNALVSEIDRIANVSTWAGKGLIDQANTFKFNVGSHGGGHNEITATTNAMTGAALGVSAGNASVGVNGATAAEVGNNVVQFGGTPAVGDVYEMEVNGQFIKLSVEATSGSDFTYKYAIEFKDPDGGGSPLVAGDYTAAASNTVAGSAIGGQTAASIASAMAAIINSNDVSGTSDYNGGITATAGSDASLTLIQEIAFASVAAEDEAGDAFTSFTSDGNDTDAVISTVDITNGKKLVIASTDDADANDKFAFDINGVSYTYDVGTADAYADSMDGVVAALQAAIDTNIAAGKHQGLTISVAKADSDAGSAVNDIEISVTSTPANLITNAKATAGTTSSALQIDTQADASAAIATIDAAIVKVNAQRADLGAISNRLDSTVNNLTSISSNLQAGRGRIEDADFAAETTSLAKSQILQQASTAMLAQANASKQNVLSLLQG